MFIDPDRRQQGVVLVFVLLVLLLLGLLQATLLRSSAMQLRVAGGLETAARERLGALAEVERILAQLGTGVPEGVPGYRVCTPGRLDRECDTYTLAAGQNSSVTAYTEVLREGAPLPRMAQARASSGLAYRSVRYEIGATDGHSTLVQGVLVLQPEQGFAEYPAADGASRWRIFWREEGVDVQ